MLRGITAAVTLVYASTVSGAAQGQAGSAAPSANPTGDAQVECKYVVTAERGSKPFQMCQTKAQWAAKAEQDAKDANRIVCRYEDKPGTKIGGRKICQPASEWAEQRRMHREQVEDIQMRTCVPGAGC